MFMCICMNYILFQWGNLKRLKMMLALTKDVYESPPWVLFSGLDMKSKYFIYFTFLGSNVLPCKLNHLTLFSGSELKWCLAVRLKGTKDFHHRKVCDHMVLQQSKGKPRGMGPAYAWESSFAGDYPQGTVSELTLSSELHHCGHMPLMALPWCAVGSSRGSACCPYLYLFSRLTWFS